jgi:mannose-6-phosphate isomerase-like protein (cupin superfamily)
MTDGLLLPPAAGPQIQAMTLKVGAEHSAQWSAFEAEVAPGFDVGAHLHHGAEEVFYVLDGELELLAFHPAEPRSDDWRTWRSRSGAATFHGGPGSFMFVPAGCPHAFFNPGPRAARMLFLVSPSGHEAYLRELMELLTGGGPPGQGAIEELRRRHDIHQLTPLTTHPAPRPDA